MTVVEKRLGELGLVLPPAAALPPGVSLPFPWIRLRANRAYASGHAALAADGTMAGPFGKVPTEVSLEQAQTSAINAVLCLVGSMQRALGDLDRVGAWLTVTGCVNAESGYPQTTAVFNPASELILSLFGPDVGQHARTALGYATLPFNVPVIVAAELEIAS